MGLVRALAGAFQALLGQRRAYREDEIVIEFRYSAEKQREILETIPLREGADPEAVAFSRLTEDEESSKLLGASKTSIASIE